MLPISFTYHYESELWASILEKAYAKLHGNFLNIEGGLPYKALSELTGAPSFCIEIEEENTILLFKRDLLFQ